MQARSVCARVVEHARKLDTRALMGMMNAGVCLYERDSLCDAAMVLAKENNFPAVTLLIQQFKFSAIDAMYAAAGAGHANLVQHLKTLVSPGESNDDLARFKAIRGYAEAGPDYHPHIQEIYKESDALNRRCYLEAMMGYEKNATPDAREQVNGMLVSLAQTDIDMFYCAMDAVIMIAAMRGDIQRIHALNQFFWGGNALTQHDMYNDPRFSRPNECIGVMTGLVLGRHCDLLDQYNAYFQDSNPALVARLLKEQGVGVGMLGEVGLFTECTQPLLRRSDSLKNFKIGVINGLMFGCRMPALISMSKSLGVLLSPEEYQTMIKGMLAFCFNLKNRWGINFMRDLLPYISNTKLNNYFKGCDSAEKFYIGATQYDEATRVIFLQAMDGVTPEDVFDIGHETVSSLMRMNRINYYMKGYALTCHQALLLEVLSDLLSGAMLALFVFRLEPHLVEKVVQYLITDSAAEVKSKKALAITDPDIHPLTHAIVDVTKAQLSHCASRLFPGLNPRYPRFEPSINETKRLWNEGLKRRV